MSEREGRERCAAGVEQGIGANHQRINSRLRQMSKYVLELLLAGCVRGLKSQPEHLSCGLHITRLELGRKIGRIDKEGDLTRTGKNRFDIF